ncbi:unnamed protein product [Cyclocybe aegerita]|uniref:Cytochrome P450 n=1 Tax=Cyclocybe aegerita TaxID=1973307 RepID=A0A8S0WW56_CYCAE|nr:unnamed protein product [Cyclocybe aegerita]
MFSPSSSVPYQVLGGLAVLYVSWSLLKFFGGFWTPKGLRNLPGPPAKSLLTGSYNDIYDKNGGWEFHRQLEDNYGSVIKIKGLLGATSLYVYDPLALHHILVKEQQFYEESQDTVQTARMVFGPGITTTVGERHRLQRKLLTPSFSIAHLREMVNIFYEVSHRLHASFQELGKKGDQEVDIVMWMSRLALELIGQSGLGTSFDTLTADAQPHPFGVAAKVVFPLSSSIPPLRRVLMPLIGKFEHWPRLGRFLVDLIPAKSIIELKSVVDTMSKTAEEILAEKKAAIAAGDEAVKDQVGQGKDVLSALLRANMFAPEQERMKEDELLAQVIGITFAAVDTTSSALSRILYLLATHKDVQDKLRQEIRDACKENGGLDPDHDTLVALPYLDAVCRETLRLYAPVTKVDRVTIADTIIPLSTPIKGIDGTDIHSLAVPKGTHIFVSILGSNRNSDLWGPDVLEWKPERWLKPLPETLIKARVPGIYSHLMTFISGGHSCIGFKFSQLEMKSVLATILRDIEFSLGDKEIHWHMGLVTTPTTDINGVAPTMPMKIRHIGKGSD